MKCPKCRRSQRFREGLTCKGCGRHYVFHPKEDPIMDGKMAAAERRASSNDTFYYTPYQLFHAVNKLRAQSFWPGCLISLFLGGAVLSVMTGYPKFALVFLALLVAAVIGRAVLGKRSRKLRPVVNLLRWKKFAPLLDRWIRAGEADRRLLTTPALHQEPGAWPEKDLYDYGAERVLIVDDDLLVDLFVANGWHASHAALVISINSYPAYIRPRVETLLREAPHVPVFLLHGCAGGDLLQRARDEYGPLLDGRPVIDFGFGVADLDRARVSIPKKDWPTASGAVLMPQRMAGFLPIAFAEQLSFEQWHQKKQHDDSGTYG